MLDQTSQLLEFISNDSLAHNVVGIRPPVPPPKVVNRQSFAPTHQLLDSTSQQSRMSGIEAEEMSSMIVSINTSNRNSLNGFKEPLRELEANVMKI